MKLVIVADVGLEASGWDPDAASVALDSFLRELLAGGADARGVRFTLRGVMEIE